MNSDILEYSKVDNRCFLAHAPEIGVIWLRCFHNTDTQTRRAIIRSKVQWTRFSQSCLLPWYKGGTDWSPPSAENYSLQEKAKESPSDLKKGQKMLIMTAYHSLIDRRIIVDGCKRAVALETAVNRGGNIPEVTVLESYGTQIHSIFPCDFNNLVRRALTSII